MTTIRRVAVLGAGTMGSGIAAQVANAGYPVLMLDVDRATAQRARDGLLARRPLPLMEPAAAERIEVGGLDTDLARVAEADWIVEVVLERLPVKRALYERLETARRPGSILSSNTSGLRLRELLEGRTPEFRRDFLITHFFNPPRYMTLCELVAGPDTRPAALEAVEHFIRVALGKVTVRAKDTPSFIGNRIGIAFIMAGVHHALALGLTPEQADAIAGKPMGLPGTGVFGLVDLVGLDVLADVCANMRGQLAPDDPAMPLLDLPRPMQVLLERGHVGRKAGAGFYRETREGGQKRRETLDLDTLEYRPTQSAAAPKARTLPELVAGDDPAARYAWALLSTGLAYAAHVQPEVADDPAAVDAAMREGYSWRAGPFEMLDALVPAAFAARLEAEGRPVPALARALREARAERFYRDGARGTEQFAGGAYRPVPEDPEAWSVRTLRRRAAPVLENPAARLWDAGDGVALLEIATKMNALDEYAVEALAIARERTAREFGALVIGSDAPYFSAGANLKRMLEAAKAGEHAFLDGFIADLQQALMGLKYAPFPVVAGARGLALGGGCEVLLHCAAVQAHAELAAGLVERNVGLLPAGGGCKEMALRHAADGAAGLARAFDLIVGAQVSGSAAQARAMRVLNAGSAISFHRDRVLADAKARALALLPGYTPPQPAELVAAGAPGRAALEAGVRTRVTAGEFTAYDAVIAGHVARVLTAGDAAPDSRVSEQALLDLERAEFLTLLHRPETLARIEHMLATGKPLRS
jgi:3-hydroxyacyl-CoA dehydrogenase